MAGSLRASAEYNSKNIFQNLVFNVNFVFLLALKFKFA